MGADSAGRLVCGDQRRRPGYRDRGLTAAAGQWGKPSKDGKFEFTVTEMHCDVSRVGSTDFGRKAQGEFCLST
ncbi:hypothetical protein L3i22_039450 [Actinoplanes sp. L3-i22]|nr:hypothetical protein L3i22_039450 [Actinoplanes sp. L3-i22]